MSFSVEYIINTGQFEHAKLTISGDNANEFFHNVLDVQSSLLEKLGQVGALAKGAVSYGYANPDSVQSSPEELIESELGGKVISTELYMGPEPNGEQASMDLARAEAAAASEVAPRPWKRPVEAKQEKPWTEPRGLGAVTKKPSQVKPVAKSDDFFD